jgi:ATP-binding cassette subfamily F protein 3
VLSTTGLSISFGPQTILNEASVTLDTSVRAGLVGANGSGKTTLLQLLAGITAPDAGSVTVAKNATIAYLPQRLDVPLETTVRGLADRGFEREHTLKTERDRIAADLEENPHAAGALHRLAEIDDILEATGYHHRGAMIGRVLDGLGFSERDLDRPLGEFSGGWQMRASLSRTLLTRADMLLLDEPTNYLDGAARLWLADFVRTYSGGVVLVSHDRAFLDDSVNVILELFHGHIRRYKGTYSRYEEVRRLELDQLVRTWEQQQAEIRRQEEFIQRFRAKASKARQVQSRVKSLEKIERIEIPQHLRPISINLPAPPDSGEIVLETQELTRRFDRLLVIDSLDLTLRRGQRLAVAGLNGAGKSTLLRTLAGKDSPSGGTLRTGTGVRIAYYAQDSAEKLPEDERVIDFITGRASADAIPRVRNILGAFLFDEDGIEKPIAVLSGGERSRLVMASLLVQPANLLILDEPTNHLDMTSQEVLARALGMYRGSLIVVSHDRYFLRSVSTDVLALWPATIPADSRPPRGWRLYPGSYREFESSHLGAVFHRDDVALRASGPDNERGNSREGTPRADNYAEHKALRGEIRRLQRLEEELLGEMERLEAEHQEIQAAMAKVENYTDPERIVALKDGIEANERHQIETSQKWEETVERLEEITSEGE